MNDSQIGENNDDMQSEPVESQELGPEFADGENQGSGDVPGSSPGEEIPDKFEEQQFHIIVRDLADQWKETNRISLERESVIDRLHQENQRLKQGELEQAQMPVFRDLIRLFDDMKSTAEIYEEEAEISRDKILRDLGCYRETIGDILYRYGVEQIETGVGDDFNSREHKAVAVATTGGLEQDRKISRIVREGFKTETRVIRNVEVEVFRCSTLAPNAAEQEKTVSETEVGNQSSEEK